MLSSFEGGALIIRRNGTTSSSAGAVLAESCVCASVKHAAEWNVATIECWNRSGKMDEVNCTEDLFKGAIVKDFYRTSSILW